MVDWARAERLYREGELSIREIARREGVSEGAVRKRAKAQGWERASTTSVHVFSLSEEDAGFLTETPTGFFTESRSEEAEPAETPTGFLTESRSQEAEPAETPTGFLTGTGSEEPEPAETPTGFLTDSGSEEAEPAETMPERSPGEAGADAKFGSKRIGTRHFGMHSGSSWVAPCSRSAGNRSSRPPADCSRRGSPRFTRSLSWCSWMPRSLYLSRWETWWTEARRASPNASQTWSRRCSSVRNRSR